MLRRATKESLRPPPMASAAFLLCVLVAAPALRAQSLLPISDYQVILDRKPFGDIGKPKAPDPAAAEAEQAKEEGRKVLVFSFFLDTIARVQEILGDRVFGPISGSIPADMRQGMVDQFAAGPEGSVLLCQIVAGGVGLGGLLIIGIISQPILRDIGN